MKNIKTRSMWTAAGLMFFAASALAQQEISIAADPKTPQGLQLKAYWFVLPTSATEPPVNRPAMVLLHGCGGLYNRQGGLASRYTDYVAVLHAAGFHALVLDSLTTRGEKELCTQKFSARRVKVSDRQLDGLAALAWLAGQPGVDPGKLGLLGWSNGGSTLLATINENEANVRTAATKAAFAVAFYPGCASDLQRGFQTSTRLLMLVGGSDDWTPPEPCEQLVQTPGGKHAELVSYPGAFHGFDSNEPVRLRKDVPNGVHPGQGVHVGGNPAAKTQSLQRLRDFLAAQR